MELINESVHGHEIMDLIYSQGKPLSIAEIIELAAQKFGHNMNYHTCSCEGMSVIELLNMFISRGKIVETIPGKFSLDESKRCNH